MNCEKFEIEGPLLITSKKFDDDRGFFTERFRVDKWQEFVPGHKGFVQDNYSWSKFGVLRGMHFQFEPGQGKLVSCVQGAVLDVIVDIRAKSPTLGRHLKVELTGVEPRWLWVPVGFAHGFLVTSAEGAGVLYKVDAYWNGKGEGAIRWNDPDLAIPWPNANPVLSSKDAEAPSFRDYLQSH